MSANGGAEAAVAASSSSSSAVAVAPLWAHASAAATLDAAPLLGLLGATKPEQVDGVLCSVFRARNEGVSVAKRDRIQTDFGLAAPAEADAMLRSVAQLLHAFLYNGCDSKEEVFALFPADFHSALRTLLSKLLLQHQAEWRETLLQTAVGPAKLVDFDWRVDVKTASNNVANMAVPTVLVDMKLQPPPTSTRLIAPLESFNFELTPAALTTLLNGLEKIQTQLSGMK